LPLQLPQAAGKTHLLEEVAVIAPLITRRMPPSAILIARLDTEVLAQSAGKTALTVSVTMVLSASNLLLTAAELAMSFGTRAGVTATILKEVVNRMVSFGTLDARPTSTMSHAASALLIAPLAWPISASLAPRDPMAEESVSSQDVEADKRASMDNATLSAKMASKVTDQSAGRIALPENFLAVPAFVLTQLRSALLKPRILLIWLLELFKNTEGQWVSVLLFSECRLSVPFKVMLLLDKMPLATRMSLAAMTSPKLKMNFPKIIQISLTTTFEIFKKAFLNWLNDNYLLNLSKTTLKHKYQ
jgi:hypothetical protein